MAKLYIALAVAAVIAGLLTITYNEGKRAGRVKQLEDTIAAEDKRNDIDARVRNLDDYERCLRIGGLPDDCAQLRGVEEAPSRE